MYRAGYIKAPLIFRKPAGTSRGVLYQKNSWFIKIHFESNPNTFGIGECSIIPNLSPDNPENIEKKLNEICKQINDEGNIQLDFTAYPALKFGLETAWMDLNSGGKRILFPSDFTSGKQGIPINGLIWMGNKESMLKQIEVKLSQGYSILKMKVGALNFQDEMDVLKIIRKEFKASDLELRLDANGAWSPKLAPEKLERLAEFNIHSLEQPIAAGDPEQMAKICKNSPLPIALDEELIGISDKNGIDELLEIIKPQYIILKPSLLGGLNASEQWIRIAEAKHIGWWVTSALESNIGLNAIAQWTAKLETSMPQGLGTGSLFTNNIPSPLKVVGDKLYYNPEKKWDLSTISF